MQQFENYNFDTSKDGIPVFDAEDPGDVQAMKSVSVYKKIALASVLLATVAVSASAAILKGQSDTLNKNNGELELSNLVRDTNVEDKQWDSFIKFHAKTWNGRWSRYNPDKSTKEWTNSQRLFHFPDISDTNFVIQNNKYEDQSFATDKTWHYKNGDPPTWALRVNEDGSTDPLPSGGYVLFNPSGSANFALPGNIQARYYFSEYLMIHPDRLDLRVSFTPVYINKRLYSVSLVREVDERPWSDSGFTESVDQLDTEPKLPGPSDVVWKANVEVFRPSYEIGVQEDIEFPGFAYNSDYVTHHYPDGMMLSVLNSVDGVERVELRATWIYDETTVLQGSMVYGQSGGLEYYTFGIFRPDNVATLPPMIPPTASPTVRASNIPVTGAPTGSAKMPTSSPTKSPTRLADNSQCSCHGGNGDYEKCVIDSGQDLNVCFIKWQGSSTQAPPCDPPQGGKFYYASSHGRWYVVGCQASGEPLHVVP